MLWVYAFCRTSNAKTFLLTSSRNLSRPIAGRTRSKLLTWTKARWPTWLNRTRQGTARRLLTCTACWWWITPLIRDSSMTKMRCPSIVSADQAYTSLNTIMVSTEKYFKFERKITLYVICLYLLLPLESILHQCQECIIHVCILFCFQGGQSHIMVPWKTTGLSSPRSYNARTLRGSRRSLPHRQVGRTRTPDVLQPPRAGDVSLYHRDSSQLASCTNIRKLGFLVISILFVDYANWSNLRNWCSIRFQDKDGYCHNTTTMSLAMTSWLPVV